MITLSPMTVDNFLEVMKANASEFPDFEALTDDQKRFLAQFNISTGSAQSVLEDGRLVGVFGIRYAEAWGIGLPETRGDRKFSMFKTVKRWFKKTTMELNLTRIFAIPKLSDSFLGHLGFNKAGDVSIWEGK